MELEQMAIEQMEIEQMSYRPRKTILKTEDLIQVRNHHILIVSDRLNSLIFCG